MPDRERQDKNGTMEDVLMLRERDGVTVIFHYPTGTVEHFIPQAVIHTLRIELAKTTEGL